MCGLSAFVSSRPGAGPLDDTFLTAFSAALATMHHRGPDDTQVVHGEGYVFGFNRLAIIDREHSVQPLSYAGRWTVVFNGEIYNYRELRAELIRAHDAVFATEGDSEVLAAAFHYWGEAALPRLRGMFAFVAYDHHTGTLHAARDAFGIKPMYLLETADGLHLASERKALDPFAPPAGAALDTESLAHYLTFQYVPDPLSLHRHIRRLPPGHRIVWTPGGGIRMHRWFKPSLRPLRVQPEAAYQAIQDALTASVRKHLHADVPVGTFLSSGVDSSAIAALASREKPDLHAFTAGFAAQGYSEIEIAQDTADQLGIRLTPTVVTDEDVLAHLPRIVQLLDDPVADPSLIPLYFLARTASRFVTVVLSGEGSDELFGGYTIYREPLSLAGVGKLPPGVKRGLRHLADVLPEGVRGRSFLERGTTPIEQRYYGNARIFTPEEKAQLMRFTAQPHTAITAQLYAETADVDDVASMQYVDLHTWLPGDILAKADRMSMAHSLELRVPFLDQQVYAAAAGLPTELKLPHGTATTKHALREAMKGIVPESVREARKLGFPTPTRLWLRGPIGDWVDHLLATSGASEYLDLEYARGLLAEHRAGGADRSRKVWTVAMFCLWHAIAVEGTISVDVPAAPTAVLPRRPLAMH
ncbi:asparagine synthase (glutamine-hydrolyzing) [Actinoplanes campanulatus]|uniref:asparagine synthase (glutamine-hydrolyzing) n=1 Tax=Actinoplanes campanulatus TaxID=113559 RepID=A0A7W5AFC8_9ACTN|nr:asparagine synthase (glutamine-hydrolyzing) [Actinoplanes campanulatus]MBB3094754.1 asparagine synthase (glutamine-hydrolyzing) [Actinoplanes campanulatus]GGN07270.1 putative asparagine synthetase AsnB [Actinoplanes campanulatus]GID36051.1 putative asparagine synthetase AsnB [Actinoplanes campanulatus]